MERIATDTGTFCIPMFDETVTRKSCEGTPISHSGVSIKNPPISVRIESFMDLIAYTLIRYPISPIKEPMKAGVNVELPIRKDGLPLSGNPQEAADEVIREIGREPKYEGYVKASESDPESLIVAARYASVMNKELKLSESEGVEIDGERFDDPYTLSLALSKIVYSINGELYAVIYQTKRIGEIGKIPPMAVPVVIGYGDEKSKALAAAYAAHRNLPLVLSSTIPDTTSVVDRLTEEFYNTRRESNSEEEIPLIKSLLPRLDPYVYTFLRSHLPLRIVYFSPEPVAHGILTDPSSEASFLGSFVPEFRIPTDNMKEAYTLLSKSLYVPKRRGEIAVIRTALEPDLTAYVPSANRTKLSDEGKILLIRLYKARLKTPTGSESGLDGVEELIEIEPEVPQAEDLKEKLMKSTVRIFEGPYVEKVRTDRGFVRIKPVADMIVSPVYVRSPLTITPIAEIPIEAYRRYVGFLVYRYLIDYNAPAAMSGAAYNMHASVYSKFPISKKKAFLMHLLSIYIQGVGEPTLIAHKNDPTRILSNITILFNGAADGKFVRLERGVYNVRKEYGNRILENIKKSREFFYYDLAGHSYLVLSPP